jgi:SAM-dependent methyltransferase
MKKSYIRINCTVCLLVLTILIFFTSCNHYLFPISESKKKDIISNSGFISDRDSIYNSCAEEFRIYNFKAGETIADIGFATAWFEGAILSSYDSLTIYAEDIDSYAIRNSGIRINKYLELRKSPNTNKIHFVKGNKKSTRLPKNRFDKVIVRETFHHFTKQDVMLDDIKNILKQGGRLFIYEPDIPETIYDKGDGAINYSRKDLLEIFTRNNFILENEYTLKGNPGNVPPWLILNNQETVPKKIYVFRIKREKFSSSL